MMYPRLFLARNLLCEDGAIFISIDDHEVANLRKFCDEIYGEENFVANIIWQKKYTRSNDAKYFSDNHDHVLMYCRNKDVLNINLLPRTEDQVSAYLNPDNHPKGSWKATPLHAKSGSDKKFTYTFKNGVVWAPPAGTYPRYSIETFKNLEEANEIWFGSDGKAGPSRKTFLAEAKDGVTPTTIWPYQEVGHNHEANSELKELGLEGIFDNPKPTRLLKRMLELMTNHNEKQIVLDFFAGSGTTGQAILEFNKQTNGNLQFILVQLPEPTERKEFPTIADITKERVRRAIKKQNNADSGQLLIGHRTTKEDYGFKCFKLQSSNFKVWNDGSSSDVEKLGKQLEMHVDHILKDRTQDDILYEILLKSGYPLTTKIETLTLMGKKVYSVQDGSFLICLEKSLTLEVIRAIADKKPERVVCLDEGFEGNDQLKTNAVQTFKSKGITSFRTV